MLRWLVKYDTYNLRKRNEISILDWFPKMITEWLMTAENSALIKFDWYTTTIITTI